MVLAEYAGCRAESARIGSREACVSGGGGSSGGFEHGRAFAPLEDHVAAQRECRLGASWRKLEAAPRLSRQRGRADLQETRVGTLAEVEPLAGARVQVLHAKTHVHGIRGMAVAGHRTSNPDRVGLVLWIAHIHRGPQFARMFQRVRGCWRDGRRERQRRDRLQRTHPVKIASPGCTQCHYPFCRGAGLV